MRLTQWVLAGLMSAAGMTACGLDGVTGTLVHIEDNWHRIRTMEGRELRVHVDETSRKDEVSVGDEVHLYVSKDGHAAFVQKLNSGKQ